MLNGILTLHDPRCNGHCHPGCIQDVEKFCGALLERRQIRRDHREYEDQLAYLIGEAWQRAARYDPGRDTKPGSGMATSIRYELARSLIERKRTVYRTVWKFKDYTYQRAAPQIVSYDAEFETRAGFTGKDGNTAGRGFDTERGGLAGALGRRGVASQTPGPTDLGRLLRTRTGSDPRGNGGLGTNGTQAAA